MKARTSSRTQQTKQSLPEAYLAVEPNRFPFASAVTHFPGADWVAISGAILQSVSEGIVVSDSQGKIVFANWAAKQLAQVDPEGQKLDIAPTIWGEMLDLENRFVPVSEWPFVRAMRGESVIRKECQLVRLDSSSSHILFSASPIKPAGCRAAGSIATLIDITEYKQRSLMRHNDEVSKERGRMAAEIHDTLLQSLNGVVLHLEAAECDVDSGSTQILGGLRHALNVARNSIKEVRRAIWSLSSESFEQADPSVALSFLANQLFQGTPVKVELWLQKEPRPLSTGMRRELVQMGKEALLNALKYARATTVRVELSYRPGEMRLGVIDDGQGFVPTSLPTGRAGFGLFGMRNRAERLGGKLLVHSQPGRGTQVLVLVPLPPTLAGDSGKGRSHIGHGKISESI
ncbi:MAG: histidine kinase [Acidobacteriaceae bacterium]|jgi:signal transduction histidine kinase|nr:histidine kinase [Acidobacteriaceae bacterium]